jgi:hypothetical protein
MGRTHGDTARVDAHRCGVLVLISKILGDVLNHKLLSLFRHPRVHKRREVQRGVPIEIELVVHELVRSVGRDACARDLELGELLGGEAGRVRAAMDLGLLGLGAGLVDVFAVGVVDGFVDERGGVLVAGERHGGVRTSAGGWLLICALLPGVDVMAFRMMSL